VTRLEVRDLSAHYGRTQVLFGVTLPTLAPGEVLGLLGPNASGKSTLMRCLSREMRGSGHVTLNGRPQQGIAHSDWHRTVAAMPQSPPAPTALLPVELMWSSARALRLDLSDAALSARIEDVFAQLGLADRAFTPLSALSGGMRQLVGLAMALIRAPSLVLLDEPTSALDLHWRMVVLDLVRTRVAGTGGAVVAALHDLDLAARYCDRIALLDGGRIVAAGTAAEVLTRDNLARIYHIEAEVMADPEGRPVIRALRPISGAAARPA